MDNRMSFLHPPPFVYPDYLNRNRGFLFSNSSSSSKNNKLSLKKRLTVKPSGSLSMF